MTTINSNIIDINGDLYTRSDYNGVSIIIHNKDNYVNATKIANDNNKRDSFKKWIKADKWNEICETYKNMCICSQGKNFPGLDSNKVASNEIDNNNAISNEIDNNVKLYYVIKTGTQETYGTYVHPDLIHFVAEWCNIKYAFNVSIIMNEINKLKDAKNKDGNEYLNKVITELKDKNERLRDKTKKQKDKIDELKAMIAEQTELIKSQTKEIRQQTNKIDTLNEMLIDHEGRLSGKDVKDSKLLMIYKDPAYNEFDKNNADTNILPLKIIRRQIDTMTKEQKEIYNNKTYLFATNLPEAINQNKSILTNILEDEEIGIYFNIITKGGKTRIELNVIKFLEDFYHGDYMKKKITAINRRINQLIEKFIRLYKIELTRATKIKVFKDFTDDEDDN